MGPWPVPNKLQYLEGADKHMAAGCALPTQNGLLGSDFEELTSLGNQIDQLSVSKK